MMTIVVDAAVYFPYINTPENGWFFRILLYWDEVKSIIPQGAEARLHLDDFTQGLLSAELITSLDPAGHVNDAFCDAFLDCVGADGQIHEAKQLDTFNAADGFDVHVSKLGHRLVEELAERHLADPAAPYGWVAVERRTARLFMATQP